MKSLISRRQTRENAATGPGGPRESLWSPEKIRFQFSLKCIQWHVFAQGWWQTVPHCRSAVREAPPSSIEVWTRGIRMQRVDADRSVGDHWHPPRGHRALVDMSERRRWHTSTQLRHLCNHHDYMHSFHMLVFSSCGCFAPDVQVPRIGPTLQQHVRRTIVRCGWPTLVKRLAQRFPQHRAFFQSALLANISKRYYFLVHETAAHLWQIDFYTPFILNTLTYLFTGAQPMGSTGDSSPRLHLPSSLLNLWRRHRSWSYGQPFSADNMKG